MRKNLLDGIKLFAEHGCTALSIASSSFSNHGLTSITPQPICKLLERIDIVGSTFWMCASEIGVEILMDIEDLQGY
jgi:hypothetical protein